MLLGLLLTLFSSLWLIFAGMLLFSAGFFAAHSVASSWIGPRARRAKGQASSLYLQLLSGLQYRRDAWRRVLA
jgi:YNFM family putative membrane transporter